MNRVSLIIILVSLAAVTYSVADNPQPARFEQDADRIADLEKRLDDLEARIARLESRRAIGTQAKPTQKSVVITALRKQVDKLNLELELNETERNNVPWTLTRYDKANKLWVLYAERERRLRKLLSFARKHPALELDPVQLKKNLMACQSDKKEQEQIKFDTKSANRTPGSIPTRRPQ